MTRIAKKFAIQKKKYLQKNKITQIRSIHINYNSKKKSKRLSFSKSQENDETSVWERDSVGFSAKESEISPLHFHANAFRFR